MEKISNLLIKLCRNLFTDSTEQEKFIDALVTPKPFNPCILWCREIPEILPFSIEPPIDWQPNFVHRLPIGERPGQHSLHDAGYYYCLDFSSVFAASTLLTITQPINLIFDMCAAPGGKSIFAWQALQPKLLICNETIGKRIGMLVSNLKRCQLKPSFVVNKDSEDLAEILNYTSDLVIVDAPCTGQSLLAKGEKNPGCFHPTLINKNANRQKRIIANSTKTVAPQGYLSYMTCTYSLQENEQVCEWFLERFPQFQPVVIPHLLAYQSHLTSIPCYRIWPQNRQGAGAFTALFKNTEAGQPQQISSAFFESRGIIALSE